MAWGDRCGGPGCSVLLAPEQSAAGRAPDYCSDRCRAAAWREARRLELVDDVAALVATSSHQALLDALSALSPSALGKLADCLSGRLEGGSFAESRTIPGQLEAW